MKMKQLLVTNWSFMRWLRLGIGLFLVIQAFRMHDSITGFFGAFFLFQAISNTGCCGVNGCATPTPGKNNGEKKEIEFEEIK